MWLGPVSEKYGKVEFTPNKENNKYFSSHFINSIHLYSCNAILRRFLRMGSQSLCQSEWAGSYSDNKQLLIFRSLEEQRFIFTHYTYPLWVVREALFTMFAHEPNWWSSHHFKCCQLPCQRERGPRGGRVHMCVTSWEWSAPAWKWLTSFPFDNSLIRMSHMALSSHKGGRLLEPTMCPEGGEQYNEHKQHMSSGIPHGSNQDTVTFK